MAKQDGIIPFKGTIDNLTFYRSQDGYLVRRKGSLNAARINSGSSFQRTRENMAEFAKAGKGAKLLRDALRSLLQNSSDSRMISRLVTEFMRAVKADQVNERGLRNVIDGEAELVQGFEFNANSKLVTTLYAPFTPAINRVTGELKVDIPPFIPANMIAAPDGATHYKITSAGAEIDFENGTYVAQVNSSAELRWDATATAPLALVNNVTANSTKPLFLALGIEFSQVVNGKVYPMKNGAFNSLALVKVSGE